MSFHRAPSLIVFLRYIKEDDLLVVQREVTLMSKLTNGFEKKSKQRD
jgi:hypothetical protein